MAGVSHETPAFLGIDFGYRNPFAGVLFMPVRNGEKILVVAEYYQDRRTIPENAKGLFALAASFNVTLRQGWADPSRPDSIEELADLLAIPIIGAPSMGVVEGQKIVQEWMKPDPHGDPGLLIHPRCNNLLRERQAYYEHQPGSGKNDTLDALRYGITGYTRSFG